VPAIAGMEVKMNNCKCPNVLCRLRNKCDECISANINERSIVNCMEDIAVSHGAKLKVNTIPDTIICDDYEEMSRKTAELICQSIKNKPNSLLCLPSGNTALRTFQILKELSDLRQINFNRAYFVQLDEWLDLEDESENCTSFLYKNFFEPLKIDKSKICLFDIHASDMDQECKKVDEFIFKHGGIDLILLGLGMNGHLGLNEPGEPFDTYSKVVTLDSVTSNVGQKYFSKPVKLTRGVTLGMRHIFESKKVILQVGGKQKADIVKKIYETRPTIKLPGTVMQLIKHGIVILDSDAASKLSQDVRNKIYCK